MQDFSINSSIQSIATFIPGMLQIFQLDFMFLQLSHVYLWDRHVLPQVAPTKYCEDSQSRDAWFIRKMINHVIRLRKRSSKQRDPKLHQLNESCLHD